MVLLSTRAQAAVLEIAPAGVSWEGLGFDLCDVAVVTDVAAEEFRGPDGKENDDESTRVVRTLVEVVARTGFAVLNADAPHVATLAGNCLGSVIFFAREPANAVLTGHRKNGGRVVFFDARSIVLVAGGREEGRIPLEQPGSRGGVHLLAATAAAWALGTPLEQIRSGAVSFVPDIEPETNPESTYHPSAVSPM